MDKAFTVYVVAVTCTKCNTVTRIDSVYALRRGAETRAKEVDAEPGFDFYADVIERECQ